MQKKNCWYISLFITAFLFSITSFANIIVLEEKNDFQNFNRNTFEVFETTNPNLDISEILLLKEKFQEPNNPNKHRPSDKIYWVKFTLLNQFQDKRNLILTFFSHEVSELHFYVPDSENHYYLNTQGANFPFEYRLYPDKNFIFNIPYSPKPTTYYMRVMSKKTVGLNFKVQTIEGFVFDHSERYTQTFFIFGLLFMVILINAYIYVQTYKSAFLHFIFYTVFSGVYLMNLDGFDFQYLWPNKPYLNIFSFQFTNFLFISSSLILSISILNLRKSKVHLYGIVFLIILKAVMLYYIETPSIQIKIDVVLLLIPIIISTYYVLVEQKTYFKYFNQYNLANFLFILCYLTYSFALDGLRFNFNIFPIIKFGILIQVVLISKNLMQKYYYAIFKFVEKRRETETQLEIKKECDLKIKSLNEKLSAVNAELKSTQKELSEKHTKYAELKSQYVLLKVEADGYKKTIQDENEY